MSKILFAATAVGMLFTFTLAPQQVQARKSSNADDGPPAPQRDAEPSPPTKPRGPCSTMSPSVRAV